MLTGIIINRNPTYRSKRDFLFICCTTRHAGSREGWEKSTMYFGQPDARRHDEAARHSKKSYEKQ